MKNTKEHIANKVGVTVRCLDYLLRAERDARPSLARRFERVTGIDKSLWVFGTKHQRQQAWKRFARQSEVVK